MADVRDLIEEMRPRVRRAFLEGVSDLTSSVELTRLQRAIAEGRIAEAVRMLHVDPAVYAEMVEELRTAYIRGGRSVLSDLTPFTSPRDGSQVVVRFAPGNPRAEAYMRSLSLNLVEDLTNTQLAGAQQALENGIRQGYGSRRIALDLVGRIDSTTGRRVGGTIGLLPREEQMVRNARDYIRTGDRSYFQLQSRDRRFDSMVRRAMDGGPSLTEDQISKISGRYSDTLLRNRGERIARTEVRRATHAGAHEGMEQVLDTGQISRNHVRKIWHATPDNRVRDSHERLSGESRGKDEPFISPATGAPLQYPGDSLNGQAEDVINCRCWLEYRIDFLANLEETAA